jgi:hypothetical protein
VGRSSAQLRCRGPAGTVAVCTSTSTTQQRCTHISYVNKWPG